MNIVNGHVVGVAAHRSLLPGWHHLAGVYNGQAAHDPVHRALWRPPIYIPGEAELFHDRSFDEVTYLRFASVYKGFSGALDFEREAGLLTKATEPKLRGAPRV